ncbi:MAG: hypothetical protein FJ255_07190 [Phycisphaerae bacterium]|nr:hypothetical protein [Phycisphaerae bacterium]
MSQIGMQMPGTRVRRGGGPDIYAGLAFVAVAFLATACVLVYQAGTKIGKDGSPFAIQDAPPAKLSLKAAN